MNYETILTNKAKRAVLKNKKLRLALYQRWEVFSFKTLQRWCESNDARLSHSDTLALICKHENCKRSELTEVVSLPEVAV